MDRHQVFGANRVAIVAEVALLHVRGSAGTFMWNRGPEGPTLKAQSGSLDEERRDDPSLEKENDVTKNQHL